MAARTASARLVGRVDELAALDAALAAASAGRPTTVLVAGEAGVGKSRLVEEFLDRAAARGARVLVGRCVELGEDGLPFAPVVGALRSLLAETGPEALSRAAGPGREALARILPEVGPVGPDSPTGQGRLFEVVTTLLERLGAEQPLVLVVEDLHWADRSTRDLLQFVVRVLAGARVLVLGTYRSDEMRRGHPLRPMLAELERVRGVDRVEVPRLSRDEVAALLTAILGEDQGTAVVDAVHRRSEGIPFFVEELASCSDSLLGDDLPDSLRDLLLVRAERLSPEAAAVLRLAAVGGTRVEHHVLTAVCELPEAELEAHLRDAVAAQVLVVDETGYSFRHALLREVLHDDLLPGEHARLHVRYAQVLEGRPELMAGRPVWAEVAHHWHAAHDADRAFRASLRAADEAATAFAHAEAQRQLERALELWSQVDDPVAVAGVDRPSVLRRASAAARDAGDTERSLALVEAAVAEVEPTDDASRTAHLLERQATLLFQLGRPERAVAVLERALDVVGPDGPPLDRAAALQVLGIVQMLRWQFADAERSVREALQLTRLARAHAAGPGPGVDDAVPGLCPHDPPGVDADGVESNALNTLGVSLVALGRTQEGLEALARSREVAVAGGRENALDRYFINASDTFFLLGRYAESVAVAREGMEEAARRGLSRTKWTYLAGNAAEPLIMLGEWAEARRLVDRAIPLEPPYVHAVHLHLLEAWLALRSGDVDEAHRLTADLETRLARRNPGPQLQFSVPLAGLRAQVDLERGRPLEALEAVLGCLAGQPGQAATVWPVLAVGARAAAQLDAQGRAAPEAWQMLRDAAARMDWWETAAFWRPLFDAEAGGDAPDPWHEAVRALEAWPGPVHLQAWARFRLATAHLAGGERAAGAESLGLAATVAGRLGDTLLGSEIERLARRARIELPGPRKPVLDVVEGSAAAGYGLTPRELEVLRLVAAGRSNRQIGEALFISTKTASVHVSNILAKLEVSGRGEAAALAHRDGLLDDTLLPA